MEYQVIIFDEAQNEYQKAAKWYEEQKTGLGSRFIDVIEKKLNFIANNPEKYAKRKSNFREAPLNIFPYSIIYTFYKEQRLITISVVFHNSRNPRKKYR